MFTGALGIMLREPYIVVAMVMIALATVRLFHTGVIDRTSIVASFAS